MKKKVYVYETKQMHVSLKREEDGQQHLDFVCLSYDTVELGGRTWLNIVGPVSENFVDMDTIDSFNITAVDEYGGRTWFYVYEEDNPNLEPQGGEEFVIVRLNS